MNIFYLHNDTKTCAEMHNDKHVVKMILEYAQLLSTAHHMLDGADDNLSTHHKDILSNVYKKTHFNHPSAVWARANVENYVWLYNLWLDLLTEYSYRYSKQHASSRLIKWLIHTPHNIPQGKFYPPTQAMPDDFKCGNSLDAYRKYYVLAKNHLAKWTKRDVPTWYESLNCKLGE